MSDNISPNVALFKDVHGLDWSPDASYILRNRPIRYVSTAKIKRQIMPILDRHDACIAQSSIGDPIIQGNRIIQRFSFRLVIGGRTIDTVEFYGEGANEGKQFIT